jgi:hypothetical protein
MTTATTSSCSRRLPRPNRGANAPGAYHGCGVLVDMTHTWHSHVPGSHTETGDHWLTARNGPVSTCAFTERAIHRLLAPGPDLTRSTMSVTYWARAAPGSTERATRRFDRSQRSWAIHRPQHPHIAVRVRPTVDPGPGVLPLNATRHAPARPGQANHKPRTRVTHPAA